MKIVFVSNYINHHQIPFCEAMCRYPGVEYTFIQTEPMEEERVRMGWQQQEDLPFLKLYYQEPSECSRMILEADVVIFGGCEDESYIEERLLLGKPLIRYSERLYKEAQWKAVSPRGLIKKYHDHVRYRKAPVYLLCSGAYVADDFHLIHAYPGKMFRWGYFPEKRIYDKEALFSGKGWGADKKIYILWAARMIDWKHPELAVRTGAWLKQQGIDFHMDLAGGGAMEEQVRRLAKELQVGEAVSFCGFLTPKQVREKMEQADIFLLTSDRKEGWGAVVNEAMNSGCAVVTDHMVGAAPYLIRHGENGMLYRDGDHGQLFSRVALLAGDRQLCRKLGMEAYETITNEWNAQNAADCLMELMDELGLLTAEAVFPVDRSCEKCAGEKTAGRKRTANGPCSPAPVIPERKMYRYLMKEKL